MIKKTVVGILVVTLFTSCVSKKIYNELENKFAELKKENRSLADNNEELQKSKNQLETDNKNLIDELAKTKSERDKLLADYTASQKNLKTLQESYNALEKNSDDALKTNLDKNRELLAKLEAKEKALTAEQARLDKLKNDLEASSKRLSELEQHIATKDANMKKLKESLTKSLKAFDGKGLTVYEKDGKVYVSMENKLLFDTGSWAVNAEGKKAVVEVGKVLAQNTDVMVLIEGHTDNDKISGNMGGEIENTGDLSTRRATAFVTILTENKAINKQNLTAAGRGEFAPIATNDNAEGKAKNRRIEIILTPKLDEISKMLNEL